MKTYRQKYEQLVKENKAILKRLSGLKHYQVFSQTNLVYVKLNIENAKEAIKVLHSMEKSTRIENSNSETKTTYEVLAEESLISLNNAIEELGLVKT